MTADIPISDEAWRSFVAAVCDKLEALDAIEGLESGLEPALALTNEALTRSGAALSVVELAGYEGTPDWLDGYLSNLVAVAASALRGAAQTGPPALEGQDAHRAHFEAVLGFAVELLAEQPQPDRLRWHLLVVQQVHKLLDAVRVLDRAERGDEEALEKVSWAEEQGGAGEWGRMIPVLFLLVAGSVLAVVSALAPEGFDYVDELSLQL